MNRQYRGDYADYMHTCGRKVGTQKVVSLFIVPLSGDVLYSSSPKNYTWSHVEPESVGYAYQRMTVFRVRTIR